MTDYTNTSQQEMEDIVDFAKAFVITAVLLSPLLAMFFLAFYGAQP